MNITSLTLPPKQGVEPDTGRSSTVPWVALAISLALHLGVVLLASQNQHHAKPAIKPVVSARLVYPVVTKPTPTSEPEPVVATPQDRPSEPVKEAGTRTRPAGSSQQANDAVQPPVATQTAVPTSEARSQQAQNNAQAGRFNPSTALQDYMTSREQALQRQQSEQAASSFRRKQSSPVLTDRRANVDPQVLPEVAPPTQVNCDSMLNKAVAFLSAIGNGTLTCSERNNLTPHIQKRLQQNTQKPPDARRE